MQSAGLESIISILEVVIIVWHDSIFLLRLIGLSLRLSGWAQLASVAGPLTMRLKGNTHCVTKAFDGMCFD